MTLLHRKIPVKVTRAALDRLHVLDAGTGYAGFLLLSKLSPEEAQLLKAGWIERHPTNMANHVYRITRRGRLALKRHFGYTSGSAP